MDLRAIWDKLVGYGALASAIGLFIILPLFLVGHGILKNDLKILGLGVACIVVFACVAIALYYQERSFDSDNEIRTAIPIEEFLTIPHASIAPNQYEIERDILKWLKSLRMKEECKEIFCATDIEENLCVNVYVLANNRIPELEPPEGVVSSIEAEVSRLSGKHKKKLERIIGKLTSHVYQIVWD